MNYCPIYPVRFLAESGAKQTEKASLTMGLR